MGIAPDPMRARTRITAVPGDHGGGKIRRGRDLGLRPLAGIRVCGAHCSMPILMLLIAGALTGLVTGLIVQSPKLGCAALWAVPLATIAYIYAWQSAHPGSLRSTSGLDFVFGLLWPSLTTMGGFVGGKSLRYVIFSKRSGK